MHLDFDVMPDLRGSTLNSCAILYTLQDLIQDIKCELSGDYKDAILACFVSPAYYDARCIKKAIYVSRPNSFYNTANR